MANENINDKVRSMDLKAMKKYNIHQLTQLLFDLVAEFKERGYEVSQTIVDKVRLDDR